jgi:deazaflavin-dependent oxidoreductase (nitroreductase family)
MPPVWARITVRFDRLVGRRSYRVHRVLYRWTGGLLGHRTPVGPMLLLTTIGRRTGQRRTTPLLYAPDGANYVVVGSNGGREQPPAWLLNLTATPAVELQVGRRKVRADAHILNGPEKAVLWPSLVTHYKGWSHYQELTERELKVVSLRPRRSHGAD